MKNTEDLDLKRHSLAHILARAIKELYPKVKMAIGPVIDNGFYYDFDFGKGKLTEEELKDIEKKMKFIIKQNKKFEKEVLPITEAIKKAKKEGNEYKLEILTDLKKEGEKEVSYYTIDGFEDLCRGPHVDSTKEIDVHGFKLDKIAGAYWRGDEKNKMLTRIYGLAFKNKADLDDYLKLRKEAEARDHRKLGQQLDLFHIDEQVGLGLPLFHPKGAMLWHLVEDFWYQEHLRGGYELVRTPHIGSRKLWEASGHWGFYSDSMYPPMEVGQSLEDKQKNNKVKESEEYLLKPMNCPLHVQIYKHSPKSYRDLPLRWAECGTVYRFEKKGELSGLTRVRGFTQDDAHIICRADQVKEELSRVIDFNIHMFKSFGFPIDKIKVYLSLRNPSDKKKYAGDDKGWDLAEQTLRDVVKEKNMDVTEEEGEAAFYGPKLDFKLKDALGREWQCTTIQFDFNLPERLNMTYINNQNKEEQPYMIHRALLGSFERFLALLIEHYAGKFPTWLSPVQVKIISVGEKHIDYCNELADEFRNKDMRVEVDVNDETVGNKIRKAIKEKVPYILVIGDKEMASNNFAVRDRGSDKAREVKKEDFYKEIKDVVESKK